MRSVKNTFVSNENNKNGLRAERKRKRVSHMLIMVPDQKSRISVMLKKKKNVICFYDPDRVFI